MIGKAIRARGIVQGVGFRPSIWRLAKQHKIVGQVWNDGEGVMIHAYGKTADLENFITAIPKQLPPLAKLSALEVAELGATTTSDDFVIVASHSEKIDTPITADAATCSDCLADIADKSNRRYRYPFTNCTHCGPRLSIVKQIPYDRCNTSMANFALCPDCLEEYQSYSDRRFHAQANCCPVCGPKVWLEDKQGKLASTDPINLAAEAIQQGFIVAIKGLGGFHLACDANNAGAVQRLRQRKQRYAKPFALMAKDLATISAYASINALEKQALQDKAAPIVLLVAQGKQLAEAVAPGDNKLGFMLPYTPLHSLLLQALDYPIVLTSGNISDEPQCISNETAREKLALIADYWLLHDREIINRLDDSVVRVMAGQIRVLRRARGYSPEALRLADGFQKANNTLAMGAELKNSFCLLKNGQAIVSQHIGDLENAAVQFDYRQAIQLYQQLYDLPIKQIIIDQHPAYLSSQYGLVLAQQTGADLHSVAHHHAHLAACLVEHGYDSDTPPVLAAIFDGLGMGDNGELWGGEFLYGNYHGYQRLGHFQPIALLGATPAMREPWRNTYAQLNHYFSWPELQENYAELAIIQFLTAKPLATLDTMLAKGLNSPLSSSCGRWFDAFAAALGLHVDVVSYEGQAAIALEVLASPAFDTALPYAQAYTIDEQRVLSWQGLWLAVLDDLLAGVSKAMIAARILQTLVAASCELLQQLSIETGCDTIVLSGGVFQNKLLLEAVSWQLQAMGKTVLVPINYPVNDGGLALGQAVVGFVSKRV